MTTTQLVAMLVPIIVPLFVILLGVFFNNARLNDANKRIDDLVTMSINQSQVVNSRIDAVDQRFDAVTSILKQMQEDMTEVKEAMRVAKA